jgi:hypothetical protein
MTSGEFGEVVKRKQLAHEISELRIKLGMTLPEFRAWLLMVIGRKLLYTMSIDELECVRDALRAKVAKVKGERR